MCSRNSFEYFLKCFYVVLINVLLFLSIALISFGISVDNTVFRYSGFIQPSEFANSSRAAILSGIFLFGIVMFQVLGFFQEQSFLMVLGASMLGYLVFVGGFLINRISSDQQRLHPKLYYGMLTTLKTDAGGPSTKLWSHLQSTKHCCGVNNYTDWKGARQILHDPQVPISCCRQLQAFCSDKVTFVNYSFDSLLIHTNGCFDDTKNEFGFNWLWSSMLSFEISGALSAILSSYFIIKWRRRRTTDTTTPDDYRRLGQISEDSSSS